MWYFFEKIDSSASILCVNKAFGKLNENFFKYLCLKVLQAIEALHNLKVIHRNIKSSSVLIDADKKEIKLGAFDSATQLTTK